MNSVSGSTFKLRGFIIYKWTTRSSTRSIIFRSIVFRGLLLLFLLLLSLEDVRSYIEYALGVFFAHVAARIFAVARGGTVLAEVVATTARGS